MKKFFGFIFIILMFFSFFNLLPAFAQEQSGLELTTAKTNYQIDETFKVDVNVKAGNKSLQVVKAKISYPEDLLELVSWSLDKLFPEKNPGELLGNGLIYAGGYRSEEPTSKDGLLGTIEFKVLAEGKAQISLLPESFITTNELQNVYTSGNQLNLILGEIIAEPVTQEQNTDQIAARLETNINSGEENVYTLFFSLIDPELELDHFKLQFDSNEAFETISPYILSTDQAEATLVTITAFDSENNQYFTTFAIADTIKQQEAAYFAQEQEKITLFDVQAESVGRSWSEFYTILVIFGVIFLIIIIGVIYKNIKH